MREISRMFIILRIRVMIKVHFLLIEGNDRYKSNSLGARKSQILLSNEHIADKRNQIGVIEGSVNSLELGTAD